MRDNEIIDMLIKAEDEQREQCKLTIEALEKTIKKRVNEGDFDIVNMILERDRLITKKNCYYGTPGYVEALRGRIDE